MSNIINLNGAWNVTDYLNEYSLAGTVPGCVHNDLLNAGIMEDYRYRFNELECQWVGERGWKYERTFDVDVEMLESKNVALCCMGLDTIAHIYVNDTPVADTKNMFCAYEFDVKDVLKVGENTIRIEFDSASVFCREKNKEDYMFSWNRYLGQDGRGWLRKCACSFGWDWGPVLATCGIWKNIFIEGYSAKLDNPVINHNLNDDLTQAVVTVDGVVKGDGGASVKLELSREHISVAEQTVSINEDGTYHAEFIIDNPELWWPHDMGAQPLYDLVVELVDADGNEPDGLSRRIGIRKIVVENIPDLYGVSFEFKVNNIPIFAKGGAWIPNNPLPIEYDREYLMPWIQDALDANYNMLRVWGGAFYPSDDFFDICDEVGLILWQDFMFACGMYPAHDPAFMEDVQHELDYNLPRFGYHACIGLLCGNNELYEAFRAPERDENHMSYADYDALFNELIPNAVAKYTPNIYYWPCSPTPGVVDAIDGSNGESGDIHAWEIWFSDAPFENYRKYKTRFVSEFGFQGFPEKSTVEAFALPEEMYINSPVLMHRQKSEPGNEMILKLAYRRFRLDGNFEHFITVSQLSQATCLQIAVEHFRRNRYITTGALYWNLNDMWPAQTWASVDCFGNWKAAHYFAKRFFDKVMISGLYNEETKTADVHIASDLLEKVDGKIVFKVVAVNGEVLMEETRDVVVKANCSDKYESFDTGRTIDSLSNGEFIIFVDFVSEEYSSSNTIMHVLPREYELVNPELAYAVFEVEPNVYKVSISGYVPALWAWVEVDGIQCKYSDNYKCLAPEEIWEVEVRPCEETSMEQIMDALKVKSLWNTYNEEVDLY